MREKLIELLTDKIPGIDNELRYVDDERVERLADYLIANGVTMEAYDCHWATETAYKNGYAKGYADAIAFARRELNLIGESITEIQGVVKELMESASRAAEGGK